jgi:LacI family gluconate utilization system Gnt-I transcriptional repressor
MPFGPHHGGPRGTVPVFREWDMGIWNAENWYHGIHGGVFQETIEAMISAFNSHGYRLLIGQSGYAEAEEDALLAEIIGRRPAGIVLTGILHSAHAHALLQNSGIPVVETWDLTSSPVGMLVGFSHEDAGKAAARYLLRGACRHPAVLTPDDHRALKRSNAFSTHMQQAIGNLVPTYRDASPTSMGDGRRALVTLLQDHPETDAIFCGEDNLALGVLVEATRQGIAIPDRLRVIGYGDRNFARDTEPALTTIRIDGTFIGKTAAEMLVARIDGRPIKGSTMDVGFSIVTRASA